MASLPDGLTLVVDQSAIPPNRSINVNYSLANDQAHQLMVQIWPASSQNLEAMAKAVTAPWAADRINVPLLPAGFVQAESRDTTYEQCRSITLDYGSVSVAMNPVGSGGIESYAIVTPGSFTATKVRGHDGYIVTDPATNTRRLVWVESPGLLVEVKGIGTDVATLQRLAESLQPVSTDAWKKTPRHRQCQTRNRQDALASQVSVPLWYQSWYLDSMSTQIAVRLPEETVAFIDELVANGSAASRAEVVSRALRREQRRFVASRDAAIIALHPNDDDFDQLAEFAASLALDVD